MANAMMKLLVIFASAAVLTVTSCTCSNDRGQNARESSPECNEKSGHAEYSYDTTVCVVCDSTSTCDR